VRIFRFDKGLSGTLASVVDTARMFIPGFTAAGVSKKHEEI